MLTSLEHWDTVYGTRSSREVSWYQAEPVMSLELIRALEVPTTAAVVDVGGGASALVDHLVGEGFTDVTVLDIAGTALAEVGARLGAGAIGVQLIQHDVLAWDPEPRYVLWHDRAVFHFLTEPADRQRYREVLHQALVPDGAVVVGTFAADGPERCSDLPTARYSAAALVAELGEGFDLVAERREIHRTPAGVEQPFTWVALRRRA